MRSTWSRTMTPCVPQKRQRKRERIVRMSTVSVPGGALLPTPLDKTAWLKLACGKRADGSELICCCGHNSDDSKRKSEANAKTWVVKPNSGNAARQKRPTRPLGPKWDSRKSAIFSGLKAAWKNTSSTLTMLHQRTPEVLV